MKHIARSLMLWLHEPVYTERVRRLKDLIIPVLRPGDEVLDVGCGSGALLSAILADPRTPPEVRGKGLERHPRGGEPIEVVAYGGGRLPFPDESFDVVLLADVLHHETDELGLLRECGRVARRWIIVKDHAREGLLAWGRIALLDWAANAPYGVKCLYRYHSVAEWRTLLREAGLDLVKEHHPMRLYPPGWEMLFGGRLQYLAVMRPLLRK
ncbi:MAG: methyltransferase domain-containing protein [Syntrophobacterales bacterium]|nr:methyltransferase domain-containing protein [Syntrophobacterales bacterium]